MSRKYLAVPIKEAFEWTCPNPHCQRHNYGSFVPVEIAPDDAMGQALRAEQGEITRTPAYLVCRGCQFKYEPVERACDCDQCQALDPDNRDLEPTRPYRRDAFAQRWTK